MSVTDVLIVGAGPVGLTLALDLGRRGVRVILAERRLEVLQLPKMERSNPRTMEIYRRLGVVDKIRAAAYPEDAPMDVSIVRSMTQPPLVHQVYPSVKEARARIAACSDGTLPREPYQLVSQYTLEGILLEELRAIANVDVRLGVELLALSQDASGVRAQLRVGEAGAASDVQASYLVGCDGAGSTVRQLLGLKLEGSANLGTVTNIFFRCDDLLARSRVPRSRHYLFAGVSAMGGAGGSLVVQDDLKHFATHLPIAPQPGVDFGATLRTLTGLDIRPDILYTGQWAQHMMVANRHGAGRVFLAGDANHLFIPAGGLGMNTGIVDAHNLAWKLAAALQGWGGAQLLESYLIERSAVAHRNMKAVAYAVEGVKTWRQIPTPPELDDPAQRKRLERDYAERVEPLNRRVYEMHGTDLGYRYDSSVIWRESAAPPADDSYTYRPSTFPGAHVPHLWLEPSVALYDRVGSGYTLLRHAASGADTRSFEAAIRARGAPLHVLDFSGDGARGVLERDLVLVRPDLHVAWRDDSPPPDPAAVAAVVTGNGPLESSTS